MAALAVSGKENMNISVVVRIRPLNGVEQSKNEKMCLDYDEKTATILMGNTPLVEKNTFTFDKVFGISTYWYIAVLIDWVLPLHRVGGF